MDSYDGKRGRSSSFVFPGNGGKHMSEEGKVLVIKGCYMCWFNRWGMCKHEKRDMDKYCPTKGFAATCPLQTAEEMYEAMKTYKYYADNDW